MPAQPAAVAGRPAARAGGLHPRTAGDQAVGAGRGKVTLCLTACSLCPLGLSVTSFYNCLQSFCGDSPTISYSCRRDALPELLASVRRRLARFGAEQLRELDDFAAEAGLQVWHCLPLVPGACCSAPPHLAACVGGTAAGIPMMLAGFLRGQCPAARAVRCGPTPSAAARPALPLPGHRWRRRLAAQRQTRMRPRPPQRDSKRAVVAARQGRAPRLRFSCAAWSGGWPAWEASQVGGPCCPHCACVTSCSSAAPAAA